MLFGMDLQVSTISLQRITFLEKFMIVLFAPKPCLLNEVLPSPFFLSRLVTESKLYNKSLPKIGITIHHHNIEFGI